MPETGLEQWNYKYTPLEAIRKRMGRAYEEAITPFFAGAVHFTQKPFVRILIVGGGKGHFSRDMLPAIKRELAEKARKSGTHPQKMEVFETDLVPEAVARAPGNNSKPNRLVRKLAADIHAIPFSDGRFDLVFGESIIHQGGNNNLEARIKEIKRVMNDKGIFIHIQDNVPFTEESVTPDQAKKAGFTLQAINKGMTPEQNKSLIELADSAHNILIQKTHAAAKANNLSFALGKVQGEVMEPSSRPFKLPNGNSFTEFNSIQHNYGIFIPENDSGISNKERRLKYSGFVKIITKLPSVRGFLNHLEKEFNVH